jgi:hypothetical protein
LVLKQRLMRVLAGALIAAAPVVAAASANADVYQYIGANDGAFHYEQRCHDAGYSACLYAQATISSAYWPTNQSWSDLAGHYFWRNTGTGSGKAVEAGAGAIYCGYAFRCDSYVHTGYWGNYDYLYGNDVGRLYWTHDNNRSIKLYFS